MIKPIFLIISYFIASIVYLIPAYIYLKIGKLNIIGGIDIRNLTIIVIILITTSWIFRILTLKDIQGIILLKYLDIFIWLFCPIGVLFGTYLANTFLGVTSVYFIFLAIIIAPIGLIIHIIMFSKKVLKVNK